LSGLAGIPVKGWLIRDVNKEEANMMLLHRGLQALILCAALTALHAWGDDTRNAADGRASSRSAAQSAVLPLQLAQAAPQVTAAAARKAQADLDTLVAAARREGEVTFYVSVAGFGERIVDGFTKKYGIKTQFIRLSTAPLLQRYSSEAAAGNISADFMLASNVPNSFVKEGIQQGWFDPISKVGIPALDSGEFPAKFTDGLTATVSILPWIMVYNTERVKAADAPKDWRDALRPQFKGQVLLSDPRSADAYYDLWTLLLDRLGEGYVTGVRAQGPRVFPSGVPATQALAAGEGMVLIATSAPSVNAMKAKGAPLEIVMPDLDTGIESMIFMTARSKAKHPNAARLLAQYLLSPEGNKWLNESSIGVYDVKGLPKSYESPGANAVARKDLINKLLGL
jgi:iron(III) transport system substrate-binding protein